MLKNMKIGKQLILTFVLVTVISSTAGVTGLIQMADMNAKYNDALVNYGFAQGDIGLFNSTFFENRAIIGSIVSLSDVESLNHFSDQLSDSNRKMDSYFVSMEKRMSNKKEKGYYNDIKKSLTEYKAVSEQVVTLAQQNKTAEAQALLQSQGEPLFQNIKTATNALTSEKTVLGHQLALDLSSMGTEATLRIFVIVLVTLAVSVTIALRISRSIGRPVKKMAEAAQRLAQGDLSVQVSVDSGNEIGQLAASFSETIESIRMYITDISANLAKMAEGDLNIFCSVEYKGDFIALQESIFHIDQSFHHTLSEINQASEQVLSGSNQVSDGAQSMAQGAAEQAEEVERLASSVAAISEQVKSNAEHTANAGQNVSQVRCEIDSSSRHMSEMMEAISQISDSSSQIGKIIRVIDDIAFQTNILALNAAVEAARAGAAGKGFAVVADEVRNLAGKSAQAAKNITSLIEKSVQQIENGTVIANQTAESLFQVVNATNVVFDAVEKISQASGYQSDAVGQIKRGIDNISSVVQTNSATAEESAAASEELSGQARELKKLVDRFRLIEDEPVSADCLKENEDEFQCNQKNIIA
ncbi:methyl-accepting chemotaxis protein [Caproiciproducens sp. R2]|uniref:methyl-accepting chemotaxis protein n=1 Tax=Caproiciproducens sp. R2 TaxID=3435187 RepID=UPI0040334B66